MQSRFITFEGGEGTGKSTQAGLLARRLQAHGIPVLVTREPGGSPGAEAIRHVLLSGAAKPLGPHAEAILFAAARDDHVRQTIRPALETGKWVICDRFADSTRVYQGVLGNVDARLISGLERLAVDGTRPDLTVILDVPPELGLARAATRRGHGSPDRYEAEALDFHRQLRAAYRDLAEREPDRCVIVEANGRPEHVGEIVWELVGSRLAPALPGAALQEVAR
jgi:dTMP kinase